MRKPYPMLPILPRMTPERINRFWSLVEKRGPDECWLFSSGCEYGAFTIERRSVAANRVAWVLHNQQELGERVACHTCDNKRRVNPSHLWAGTRGDNNRDSAAKGLHRNGTAYVAWNGAKRAALVAGAPLSQRSSAAKPFYIAEIEKRKAKR